MECCQDFNTLKQREEQKFRKLENIYSSAGLAFVHVVLACFCGIGPQAATFLCTLDFLKLRKHEALLDLLDLRRC